jgi:LemA protein
MNEVYILIILSFLIVLPIIITFNSLVTLRARIHEALSGIDIQLKRRFDLVPNLVETVKAYASHEKSVFQNVTEARSALIKAEGVHDKAQANDLLTGALKSLFAVAEAYPELKANENFKELQRQLEDTEDKVAYSRQFYNSQVLDFNTKIAIFPINLVSGPLGFNKFDFFKSDDQDKDSVKVAF